VKIGTSEPCPWIDTYGRYTPHFDSYRVFSYQRTATLHRSIIIRSGLANLVASTTLPLYAPFPSIPQTQRFSKTAFKDTMAPHSEDLFDEDDAPSINPYEVLGIEKTATADEVKSAYRKAALKNHPGTWECFCLSATHLNFTLLSWSRGLPISLTARQTKFHHPKKTSLLKLSKPSPLLMPSCPRRLDVHTTTAQAQHPRSSPPPPTSPGPHSTAHNTKMSFPEPPSRPSLPNTRTPRRRGTMSSRLTRRARAIWMRSMRALC